MAIRYRIFAPENDPAKFEGQEDKVFKENVSDLEAGEQFQGKIMVSQRPREGYEPLQIQIRGDFLKGLWFIKIVEREKEEEVEVTIFKPAKFSERRGYMLRSMMEDDKQKRKEEIMTSELEEKEKKKKEMVERMRKK